MAKWNEEVKGLMAKLVIASPEDIGVIMARKGAWAAGVSARNNSAKVLNALADLGALEKVNGAFRLPGCKSERGEHADSLTGSLVKILTKFEATLIAREKTIPQIHLRPDALCLIRWENRGIAVVFEQVNHEKPEDAEANKGRVWANWNEALPYLSNLFGYRIPRYQFLLSTNLDRFLEGL